MKPVFTTLGLVSLGGILGVVANHPSLRARLGSSATALSACSGTATADADGDGLPDQLEWLFNSNPLLTDSDGDAVPDFVEVVTGTDPVSFDARPPAPREAFRVVPFVTRETIGGNSYGFVYINQLYRITTRRIQDVQSLSYFVDVGGARGLRIEATQVMIECFDEMDVIDDPQHGLLVRLTMKVPLAGLESIPGGSMFGAYTRINGQDKAAGGVVAFHGTAPTTILPLPNSTLYIVQPLDPADVSGSTIWTRHRFCQFDLVVTGSSRNGQLCTIENADCSTAVDRACAPDCRSSNGGIIFIPDGLAILKGG